MSKLSTSSIPFLVSLIALFSAHCSSGGPTDMVFDPGVDPVGVGGGTGGDSGAAGTGGTGPLGGSGGLGGSSGTGGDGGTAAAGGEDAGPDASLDANFGYDSPVGDTSLNPDSACAVERVEVTQTPLDMYIMLDRSGSMVEPDFSWYATGPGEIAITGGDCDYDPGTQPINSRWCYSVYALAGYFTSPEAAGNRAAFQVYPIPGYNCDSPTNNTLSTPLVGYQNLGGAATNLINALNTSTPLGSNTPTKAALQGLAGFTAVNQVTGRITIAILITDGIPNSCAPDTGDTLGAIAAAHLTATGIKTYVIGMTGISTAGYQMLEAVAIQGGAPAHTQYCAGGINPCHFYDVGQGNPQVFINVLQEIQKNAIGCTYSLPKSDAGIVDPDQIIVEYTPGGGTPIELTRVNSAGACGANSWYYDNSAPPNIVLCPLTCAQVENDPQARIDILVGCEGS